MPRRRHYCDELCRSGYRADMRHGLVYGLVGVHEDDVPEDKREHYPRREFPGGVYFIVGWEAARDMLNQCRYCTADLTKEKTHA